MAHTREHWYDEKGNIVPEATLREARKNHYFPSVTTVLSELNKQSINEWKIREAIMETLTVPAGGAEDLDAIYNRVKDNLEEHFLKAASWGSKFHSLVEWSITMGQLASVEDDDSLLKVNLPAAVSLINDIFEPDKISTEESFTNTMWGYGGRVDLHGKAKHGKDYYVADLKTQATKKGKVTYWPEWSYQLAANKRLVLKDSPLNKYINTKIVSIVVSSTEENVVDFRLWDQKEEDIGWYIFLSALKIFRAKRKYMLEVYDGF